MRSGGAAADDSGFYFQGAAQEFGLRVCLGYDSCRFANSESEENSLRGAPFGVFRFFAFDLTGYGVDKAATEQLATKGNEPGFRACGALKIDVSVCFFHTKK